MRALQSPRTENREDMKSLLRLVVTGFSSQIIIITIIITIQFLFIYLQT
jgi:hypothetical protein